MVGLPVMAAESDAMAHYLATTSQQKFLNLIRGKPTQSQPPVEQLDWSPMEQAQVSQFLGAAIIGGPDTVKAELEEFQARTGADELMINSDFYNHADRLRSYEIVADVVR